MVTARLLLVSTPIGPLGSGLGGGVELTLANVARALADRGHRVDIVAPEGSVVAGFDVHAVAGGPPPTAQHLPRDAPVEMPPNGVLGHMLEAARRRQRDYDVIVNFAYDWLAFYLTPFFATPLAHVLSMGSLTDAMDAAAGDVVARYPGRVAAHTRVQAETYAFGRQLVIVGNGLDLARYRFNPTPEAQLGWVARIAPEKGLEDAAAAAAAVGLPLHVWGVVEDRAYWATLQATFGSTLVHRGFVPTDRLQDELGRCRALLVTPKWVEAFGNVVPEALATGVPVVAYARGGPAELVRPGRTGVLVEPDSVAGLVAALDEVGTIDRAECRLQATREFSLEALGERYEHWLAGVLDR